MNTVLSAYNIQLQLVLVTMGRSQYHWKTFCLWKQLPMSSAPGEHPGGFTSQRGFCRARQRRRQPGLGRPARRFPGRGAARAALGKQLCKSSAAGMSL